MSLTLTSGPTSEPITVAEAKAHLRIDTTAEDVLISSLILTSRLHIEAALGLALITQSWLYTTNAWPNPTALPLPFQTISTINARASPNAITLPLQPVTALASIQITTADGSITPLPPTACLLDKGPPARVVRTASAWPTTALAAANAIAITFTAGFGPNPSDIPQPIRQAMLLLVAHWYQHRDPIEIGEPDTAIPKAVSDLLRPYRRPNL